MDLIHPDKLAKKWKGNDYFMTLQNTVFDTNNAIHTGHEMAFSEKNNSWRGQEIPI